MACLLGNDWHAVLSILVSFCLVAIVLVFLNFHILMDLKCQNSNADSRKRSRTSDEVVRAQSQPDTKKSLSDTVTYDSLQALKPAIFVSSPVKGEEDKPWSAVDIWLAQHNERDSQQDDISSVIDAVTGLDATQPTIPSSSVASPTSQQQAPEDGGEEGEPQRLDGIRREKQNETADESEIGLLGVGAFQKEAKPR
jgi:hypothetical protein